MPFRRENRSSSQGTSSGEAVTERRDGRGGIIEKYQAGALMNDKSEVTETVIGGEQHSGFMLDEKSSSAGIREMKKGG